MKSSDALAIFVRGLPGSGKSYIASRLVEVLGKDRVVVLDPDAVDLHSQEYRAHVEAQIAEGVDPSLHLYRFSRAAAYKGIEERKILIWNQPFTNLEVFNKMIDRLREHAELHDTHLLTLVVEVEVSPDVAKSRVDARKKAGGHGPSTATWSRFVRDYNSFFGQPYPVITVRGEDEVSESILAITRVLSETFELKV